MGVNAGQGVAVFLRTGHFHLNEFLYILKREVEIDGEGPTFNTSLSSFADPLFQISRGLLDDF